MNTVCSDSRRQGLVVALCATLGLSSAIVYTVVGGASEAARLAAPVAPEQLAQLDPCQQRALDLTWSKTWPLTVGQLEIVQASCASPEQAELVAAQAAALRPREPAIR